MIRQRKVQLKYPRPVEDFLCHGSASNEPANAQRPLELTEDNFQRGVMDL